MSKKNIAVILAAGSGERSGFDSPKQLVKIAGKPIVEHTITKFEKSTHIDEIIVVTSPACVSKIEEIILNGSFSKVRKIITGGKERYESSLAAIQATEDDAQLMDVNLIFHDAVRPLVNDRIIKDVVQALEYYSAVDVVVPATDTIISADPITNTIDGIPPRHVLRNGQTPQGFRWQTIRAAYNLALSDPGFTTTDDCGVVYKYLPQTKVFLVKGEISNIKLTYKEDYHVMDKLIQLSSKKMVWSQLNSHSLARLENRVIVIVGGTSGIGAAMAAVANAYQAKVVVLSRRNGFDVTNVEQVRTKLESIHAHEGRIDYVVNCAGILVKQPLSLMQYKDVLEGINVNYIGAVHLALESYKYLRETSGHLLNFTSSSYTYGRAFYSLYSSCKAAVVNLTQALAEEWHTQHVRVNCINPERTDTPMRRNAFGIEPDGSLLSANVVALFSLGVLQDPSTGHVFDITNHDAKQAMQEVNMEDTSGEIKSLAIRLLHL
jgi:2-C-methyl-D-erythritol 4-phosphate cytidylyltransferase